MQNNYIRFISESLIPIVTPLNDIAKKLEIISERLLWEIYIYYLKVILWIVCDETPFHVNTDTHVLPHLNLLWFTSVKFIYLW